MKYTVKPTSKFQKDLKRIQKRGYDMRLMTDIIKKLANGEILPPKNRDHNLSAPSATRSSQSYLEFLIVLFYVAKIDKKAIKKRLCAHHMCIASLHSFSLNPVSTKSSPITRGRFTSIPSVARSFSCSSSDISFNLSFNPISL